MKIGEGTMFFMFETAYQLKLTDYSVDEKNLEVDYHKRWENLPKVFNKDQKKW